MITINTHNALTTLYTITAGQCDLDMLRGPAHATARSHIMSALYGTHVPQAAAKITELRDVLYDRCHIQDGCEAKKKRDFILFAQDITDTPRPTGESE